MSQRLQVLITDELDSRLSRLANRSGVSREEWVRRALESALRAPDVAIDPVAERASPDTPAPATDIGVMLSEIDRGRS